jgi:hypothetical protein
MSALAHAALHPALQRHDNTLVRHIFLLQLADHFRKELLDAIEVALDRRNLAEPRNLGLTRPHLDHLTPGAGAGLSWLQADGSGGMQTLTQGQAVRQFPFSWSPDGKNLAFAQYDLATGGCCEIWILPVSDSGQPGEPKPFLKLETAISGFYAPQFSPDGHWLAYSEYVSSVPQIFVVPFPGPGGKWQVSITGGNYPQWSKTGHELFYVPASSRGQKGLAEVTYSVAGNSFQPGRPTELFVGNFEPKDPFPFYDVAPDGKHFAMLERVGGKAAEATPPTVVLNWFTRVARMVAASQK